MEEEDRACCRRGGSRKPSLLPHHLAAEDTELEGLDALRQEGTEDQRAAIRGQAVVLNEFRSFGPDRSHPRGWQGDLVLTSKKAGVGAATGQETHELGLSSQKRRQAGLGERIRVLQSQAAKSTLTNLSKKGKILAKNWVIERRDKRLKKQVLK